MDATPDLDRYLTELHDEYAWLVNAALDEGREDLATQLSDTYTDRALRVLARTGH